MRLTKTQEGILNAETVIGGSVSNVCGAIFFAKPYTPKQLNDAVNTLDKINDAFRIRVNCKNRIQWVEEFSPVNYEVLHFEKRSAFDSFAHDYSHTAIDLNGRLSDLKIFTFPGQTGIIYRFHHLICDAWSLTVLRWQVYQILEKNTVPPAFSFLKYAERAAGYPDSKKYVSDKDYFLGQFLCNRERLFLPDTQINSHVSETVTLEIGEKLTAELAKYAQKTNLSTYVLLLTAFGIYYSKTHGNPDRFYLGTAVLNRTTQEERNTVGPFLNDIPFLFDLDYSSTLKETAELIGENMMSAFRHQRFNYPMFQEAVAGKVSDPCVYDVVFSFQPELDVISDYYVKWYQNGMQAEHLQIHIDHRNDENCLSVTYNYLVEKFDESQILSLHRHYMNILSQLLSNDTLQLAECRVMADDEKNDIITGFNRTAVPYEKRKSIYELFREQAEQTPERKAVIFRNQTISYSSLLNLIDATADRLYGFGICPSDVVAICLDRSPLLFILQFAVLKLGAVFLPVDKRFPRDRLAFLCRDCKVRLLVSDSDYVDFPDIRTVGPDELLINNQDSAPSQVSYVDNCYIIYTSGSTGVPKGCFLKQSGLVNFCINNNTLGTLKRNVQNVFACVNSVAFDYFIAESIFPLLNGFTVSLCDEDESLQQSAFLDAIRKNQINVLMTTPTRLSLFFDDSADCGELMALDCICSSGEPLTEPLLEKIFSLSPNAAVFNPLGPSECTVWNLGGELDRASGADIHLGKPIANTQVFVLDNYMQPVPIGVTGELCIAGDGVGGGYLNRPELTAERFVDNPFGEGKLYKSGDLVRMRRDGNVVFVGRNDFQVKVNGQRVELGEIEAAVLSVEGVENAAVISQRNKTDGLMLCAFYTGREYEQNELRNILLKSLPVYMIPFSFFHLNEMPLTVSGKIDRKALELIQAEPLAKEYSPPVSEKEIILTKIIAENLDISQVGRTDQFLALGGDSIRAIRVTAELQRAGYELKVSDLMRGLDISELAQSMETVSVNTSVIEASQNESIIPLPPLAQAYLAANPAHPDKFVQSCIIRTPRSPEAIKKALRYLTRTHEILRAVQDGSALRILPQEKFDERFCVSVQSVDDNQGGSQEARRRLLAQPVSINLTSGPLTEAVCCVTSAGCLLKLSIHHFVVDLFSWEILLPELKELLSGDCAKDSSPPFKIESGYRQWIQILKDYNHFMPPRENAYWKCRKTELDRVISLFNETDPVSAEESVRFNLSSDVTQSLLKLENENGIRMDVSLLAALGCACTRIANGPTGICLESIGRADLHIPVQLDRAVGWFTSVYPLVNEKSEPSWDNLYSLGRILRRTPKNGVGWLLKNRILPEKADLMFNFYRYHAYETDFAEPVFDEGKASLHSLFPRKISVDCMFFDGVITVYFRAPSFNRSPGLVQKLADAFETAVKETADIQLTGSNRTFNADNYSDPALTQNQRTELESLFAGMEENESD